MNINDLLETNLYDNTLQTKKDLNRFVSNVLNENSDSESDISIEQSNHSDQTDQTDHSKQSEQSGQKSDSEQSSDNDMYGLDYIPYENRIESLSGAVLPLIKDISLHNKNYTKKIISYLTIDSQNRNIIEYPNSCYYKYKFNKDYTNIYSIKLDNIKFKDIYPSINKYNSECSWTTYYSNTSYQYIADLDYGNYSICGLKKIFELNCNQIKHSIIVNNCYYPLFRLTGFLSFDGQFDN
jgi:peptide methionine sulfoxide reductase MsrB